MSITAIVALLQSALLLLGMAQTTSSLDPAFKQHAIEVAQSGIAQATTALSGSSDASSSSKAFTTPSGAVISDSGAVVSTPPQAAPTILIRLSTTTVQAQPSALGPVATKLLGPIGGYSMHIEWDTGIPTDAKIFFTSGGSTRVIPSLSGNSTHHIADIQGLARGTQYPYVIEAIAGEQDQKVSGTWRIWCPVSSPCVVRSD